MYTDETERMMRPPSFFEEERIWGNPRGSYAERDGWGERVEAIHMKDYNGNYRSTSSSLGKGATRRASERWFTKHNDLISHDIDNRKFDLERREDKDIFKELKNEMKDATSFFGNSSEWNHVTKTFRRFINAIDGCYNGAHALRGDEAANLSVETMYRLYNYAGYSKLRVVGKELYKACTDYLKLTKGRGKNKKRKQGEKEKICKLILKYVISTIEIKRDCPTTDAPSLDVR